MLSTDSIISERQAITDLRTACAQFRSTLQDIQCKMGSQGNRETVGELLDDLSDSVPSFDAMVECLELAKNES